MVKSNAIEISFKSYMRPQRNQLSIQSGYYQKCSLCERVETYIQILHGFLVLSDLMLCSFTIHIFFSNCIIQGLAVPAYQLGKFSQVIFRDMAGVREQKLFAYLAMHSSVVVCCCCCFNSLKCWSPLTATTAALPTVSCCVCCVGEILPAKALSAVIVLELIMSILVSS